MAVIDLNELQKRQQMPQQGQYIPPQQGNDGWARLERVLGNINNMVEMVLKLRENQPENGATVNGHEVLTNDSTGQYIPPPDYRKQPAERAKPLIPPELVQFIGAHLETCLKENPEMPFIEVLQKVPLTVTNLAVVFQNLRGQ